MALPPKLFYPVTEIASRWSVQPIDIVGWAIDERIALSAALPLLELSQGRSAAGLVEICGHDVFELFGNEANRMAGVRIQRFRRRTGGRWERIVVPADGFAIKASAVLIARTEVERFEREHGLFGQQKGPIEALPAAPTEAEMARAGAPPRYNWDAFAGAVARRVHDEGMPASQGELVRDMLDWFATKFGVVPDESTVRRRVRAMWPVLIEKT